VADVDNLNEWVGRTEMLTDELTTTPLRALASTLDRDDPKPKTGNPIPPGWHWLYFLPLSRQSDIGPDGHSRRGDFIPPVPLPRRMWSGSRIKFAHALRVGDRVTRTSRIAAINRKMGRTGELIFVQLHHELSDASGIALVEEQDLVYRELPKPGDSPAPIQRAPDSQDWSREFNADSVLLFRYSALTFNGHRIHYDRRYAVEVEGYPGLVVHGPLIATLLLDGLRRHLPGATVASFEFRAFCPLFDSAPFHVCGRKIHSNTVQLWARRSDGALAVDATATLSS
jgi:3-methylfumaryl-CoA hydratase